MKKLILLFVAVSSSFLMYSQPISDNAIIPISVSLNSILRLNVTSGGNIDFQVNAISQFSNGIANTARYTTVFTVASSIDYDVLMYAEGANLVGSDLAAHQMGIGNVGYIIDYTGVGGSAAANANFDLEGANVDPAALAVLSAVPTHEIVTAQPVSGGGLGDAGDIAFNQFTILWELATPAARAVSGLGTLLSQNLAPDRYTTSVFLALTAH